MGVLCDYHTRIKHLPRLRGARIMSTHGRIIRASRAYHERITGFSWVYDARIKQLPRLRIARAP